MNLSSWLNILSLGGSSDNPCLALYDISQQKLHSLINIKTKSSIYAMDFNIEDNTLAAATKDGFIYIIDINQSQATKENMTKK